MLADAKSSFFTKSDATRWDVRQESTKCPVKFRGKDYPSASAALEAYISEYDGHSFVKPFRDKYEYDIQSLLTRNQPWGASAAATTGSVVGPQPATSTSSRPGLRSSEDLKTYLAIRHIVDDSYNKLEQKLGLYSTLEANRANDQSSQPTPSTDSTANTLASTRNNTDISGSSRGSSHGNQRHQSVVQDARSTRLHEEGMV